MRFWASLQPPSAQYLCLPPAWPGFAPKTGQRHEGRQSVNCPQSHAAYQVVVLWHGRCEVRRGLVPESVPVQIQPSLRSTTLDIYQQFVPESQQRVVEKLSSLSKRIN